MLGRRMAHGLLPHGPCSTSRYREEADCAYTSMTPAQRSVHARKWPLHAMVPELLLRPPGWLIAPGLRWSSSHPREHRVHLQDIDHGATDTLSLAKLNE